MGSEQTLRHLLEKAGRKDADFEDHFPELNTTQVQALLGLTVDDAVLYAQDQIGEFDVPDELALLGSSDFMNVIDYLKSFPTTGNVLSLLLAIEKSDEVA